MRKEPKEGMARIIEVLRLINLFNHFPTAYFGSGRSCNSAKPELLMTLPKLQFMLPMLSPRPKV